MRINPSDHTGTDDAESDRAETETHSPADAPPTSRPRESACDAPWCQDPAHGRAVGCWERLLSWSDYALQGRVMQRRSRGKRRRVTKTPKGKSTKSCCSKPLWMSSPTFTCRIPRKRSLTWRCLTLSWRWRCPRCLARRGSSSESLSLGCRVGHRRRRSKSGRWSNKLAAADAHSYSYSCLMSCESTGPHASDSLTSYFSILGFFLSFKHA
ncbi:hypothetical protein FB45DRAFT_259581 [Roridomyces roridus]|uniref:Uncharacterized protein n=1 Tax=Roridomyces roridus TaxID=1738132 RepID=A0AAD7B933_9AGAR|nr:hypothetical protein FB45DRAFT_259581 [Roridomyces roridus]